MSAREKCLKESKRLKKKGIIEFGIAAVAMGVMTWFTCDGTEKLTMGRMIGALVDKCDKGSESEEEENDEI